MSISLIPPAEAPANDAHSLEEMTEESARGYLRALRSEKLDELRARAKTVRTSELVAMLSNPEIVYHTVSEPTAVDTRNQQLTMAAMLALADELDRRVPIPK